MPGDIRSSSDRSSWPISWRSQAPLLERALVHLPPRGETRARRIVGPPPEVRSLGNGLYLVDDELVGLGERDGDPERWTTSGPPNGPWRFRPGRIIAVR
jgi:hypothetical protein